MTSYVDFYHYTSSSGLRGITTSGFIRNNPSSSRHAHFGEGTYGTSMPPSRGKLAIAINNWNNHGPNYIRSGSVDWAIKLKIPSTKVRQVGGFRDILVHSGPIYLKDYEWEKMEVPGGVSSGSKFSLYDFSSPSFTKWRSHSYYDFLDHSDDDVDDWYYSRVDVDDDDYVDDWYL